MSLNMDWKFKKMSDDDSNVDPGIYQHFKQRTVDSLVREVIQNSIDAKRDDVDKVRIEFTFATAEKTFTDEHFEGQLPKHLGMPGALKHDSETKFDELRDKSSNPKWNEGLDFLLIEDYGTDGLTGNHETMSRIQRDPATRKLTEESKSNRFRMFHWDWGNNSADDTGKGGAWGYGKAALTKASRIKSILTMTTRNRDHKDDSTLEQTIFGHSLVSSHDDGKGNSFRFYGHYQRNDTVVSNIFPRSTKDGGSATTDIEKFCTHIGSKRCNKLKDRGLSIFIPWYEEGISFESITTSIIENYSVAFQMGLLEVQIKDDSRTVDINVKNIQDQIDKMKIEEERKFLLTTLNRLAAEPQPTNSLKYTRDDLNIASLIDNMKDVEKEDWFKFFNDSANGTTKSARIEVPFSAVNGTPHDGYFTVKMEKQYDSKHTFLHRHIIRTTDGEKKNIAAPNVLALVFVGTEDSKSVRNPLHQFLRLCEGPAHMEWVAKGNERAKMYVTPTFIVTIVSKFVSQFYSEIMKSSSGEITGSGWLKLNMPGNRKKPAVKKKKKGTIMPVAPMPLKSLKNTPTGKLTFVKNEVATGKNELKVGDKIRITIANDTTKGNAFKKWDEDDFVLAPSKTNSTGVKPSTLKAEENWITLTVENPDTFQLIVSGFNSNYERTSKSKKE